ncbi:MAG: orotate phosphoribosyltransferase [Candidatus Omnitrophota bacterium]|nr:orotate phosphoribosyltransferase [Candidatus Omnitrophota bacterium]
MNKESVAELKSKLLALLKKEAYKKGKFVLSSGRTSDYYLDGRAITLTPQGAYLVASIILEMIKDDDIDAVGGPTLGADPIVGAIACLAHINNIPIKTFIVRKSAKGHGTQRQIEGPQVTPGSKVLLVDDIATTGKALIEAKEALDKAQVKVYRSIVIVDRKEGAAQNLEKSGLKLECIFKIEDLHI